MDAAGDATDYESHWSKWHSSHPGTEWHLTYEDIREVLRPFLVNFRAQEQCQIVDLGCGTSTLGLQLLVDFPEAHLTLVDVSESLVESLKAQHAANSHVSCMAGDCRSEQALAALRGIATLVIDKGTVDALHHSAEKVQMLKAAASLLRTDGVIISISFATATQVLLLQRLARDLNLRLVHRVVKVRGEVRLVSLLGALEDSVANAEDLETRRELDRLLYSSPLRSEPMVLFNNPALSQAIMVEQEVEKNRSGEDCTGCIVWPSAHSMCAHLCAHPELVRGKRVVELGAGTGLVGLVCSALGAAEVVLTDLSQGLPLLQRNVQLNVGALGGAATRVAELRWGQQASIQVAPEGCDVVIGCEVIYQHDDETASALVATMRHLAGKDGSCLMAYEFRDGLVQDAVFFDAVNEVFEVSAQSLAPYGFGLSVEDSDDRLLYTYWAKVS